MARNELKENKTPSKTAEALGGEAQAGAKIMDSEASKDPFQKRWEEFYAPRLEPALSQELRRTLAKSNDKVPQGHKLTSATIDTDWHASDESAE